MVFEAYGGAHDVGGPAADFKREEVFCAGLAEATLVLHDPWGGNRPGVVAAAVYRPPQNSFWGAPLTAPAQGDSTQALVSACGVMSGG